MLPGGTHNHIHIGHMQCSLLFSDPGAPHLKIASLYITVIKCLNINDLGYRRTSRLIDLRPNLSADFDLLTNKLVLPHLN